MSSKSSKKPCRYFSTEQGCRNGAACPFQHEPSTSSSHDVVGKYSFDREPTKFEEALVMQNMINMGKSQEEFIDAIFHGKWQDYLFEPENIEWEYMSEDDDPEELMDSNSFMFDDDDPAWRHRLVTPVAPATPVASVASGQTEEKRVSAAVVPAPHASFSRPGQVQRCDYGNKCTDFKNGKCKHGGHDQAPVCRFGSKCRKKDTGCLFGHYDD